MFDSVQEPEDIFAGTDPIGPGTPVSGGGPAESVRSAGTVRVGPPPWLFVIVAAVVFGALGGGGYYWYSLRAVQPAPETADVISAEPVAEESPAVASGTDEPSVQDPVEPAAETAVEPEGTVPESASAVPVVEDVTLDTDGDGLTDFDEVRIYKSNPTLADTDGDGYPDGQEVAGGYNPNGSGRLFEVPNRKRAYD